MFFLVILMLRLYFMLDKHTRRNTIDKKWREFRTMNFNIHMIALIPTCLILAELPGRTVAEGGGLA